LRSWSNKKLEQGAREEAQARSKSKKLEQRARARSLNKRATTLVP